MHLSRACDPSGLNLFDARTHRTELRGEAGTGRHVMLGECYDNRREQQSTRRKIFSSCIPPSTTFILCIQCLLYGRLISDWEVAYESPDRQTRLASL
jgi:hypothetical protein